MRELYKIDADILSCIDEETGEIIDEQALTDLQVERDTKVEAVACWIKDLKAEAEALKAEKMAFAERQKVAENKIASLKHWLVYALDGQSFKTVKTSVSFKKSSVVEVTDLKALMDFDDGLVKFAEPTPDKIAIKQAFKDGINVAGCQLKENMSAIIK